MAKKIVDPVAQSFFIEQPSVVTKVDLYFSNKDEDFPVLVQMRKNVGGVPGPYIIPFSTVVVPASNVNTSSNANVATSVSFSSPVFLDTGEYSLTLGSISNNYKVWISELDGIDTVTEKRITEQPFVGSLFYSQNASTWTPVQAEDLKFKLYRANFNTAVTGSITYTADNFKYLNKTLGNNPLEVFPDSTTMRVYHTNHGLSEGGYVYISGLPNSTPLSNVVESFYSIPATDIENVLHQVSNVTLSTYTVDLATKANANVILSATRFGGAGVYATQDIQFDTIYPVISSVTTSKGQIRPSFKATSKNYSVDSTFTLMADGDNDLKETRLIAGNATTENNLGNAASFLYRLDLSTSDSLTAPLVDTKQLGIVLAKNLVDSPTYDDSNLGQDIITVASTAASNITQLSNEIGLLTLNNSNDRANAKVMVNGTVITISGSNPNNGQYRVVDVLEDGANVKIAKLTGTIVTDWSANTHTVTNGTKFVAEEAASGGTTFSKYITRQIDFINASTALKLLVEVCQPADARVELYYKVKNVGETEILSNKEFTKLENVSIPTSLAGEFYDVEHLIEDIEPFNAVIFKVVFTTANTAQPPKIRKFRLIALA